MATENVGILTNAGQALLQQANAGKTKITYTRVVFSSDDNSQLADADVKALTDVKTQNVTIKPPIVMQDPQTGETIIRAVGDNKNLTDGIYIHTYGVYAADDSGKEVLYGVTVTSTPDYLVGFDGRMAQAVAYSYRANIQGTDNVNFTDAGDVYLMKKDLQGYLANYVQVSQLADYAKTVDVNQQLDKKVNVADMRKPASDVVGLEDVSTSVYQSELANGTDIHTVTKDGIYPLGYRYVNFIDSGSHWGTLQVINNNAVIFHIAKLENGIWFESCSGTPLVWGTWHKISSDDEVAHLSGANNFDTVPTVNHNPLLLASSLPSDLARTGQDNNFTKALQRNGQDVLTAKEVDSQDTAAKASPTDKGVIYFW